MKTTRSHQARKQLLALAAAVALALGVIIVPTAAQSELCFNVPGVGACVAPEFREYWQQNGGLTVFGYPIEAAKQENGRLVQYFERQRLELHPENPAPYTILLGRVNDDVLQREGRAWRAFPTQARAGAGCVAFAETQHAVCGEFLRFWRSRGLDLGQPGVSAAESLALWGLPLSEPQTEINLDGDQVLTQHFERARFEVPAARGRAGQVQLTRLGIALVPLKMKILAVNDFHGQLSTGRTVASRPAGGAAYLAAYIKQRRAQVPDSVLVHAGDMVGASPLVSALLQDQPTMEVMNMMNFTVGTSGNHEFDEGIAEYRRLVDGGCHPTAGCWEGSRFPYVTSNVVETATGKTIFPAYQIVKLNGARIGFVGAVLKDTPSIVTPSGVAGLEFRDEAESINAVVPELQRQGVRAIVVLIHQGGTGQSRPTDPLQGAIVEIAKKLNPEVDIIVSGHTHSFSNTVVEGKLITQAFSYSTAFADIDVTIDRARGDIIDRKAEIVTTFNDGIAPDPEVAALVSKYEQQVAPLVNREVGSLSVALSNERTTVDNPLGSLIADAQRDTMGTQFAFMNPGGIRAPLDAGPITYGELFTVQPFGNNLVRMNYTGEQIYALLNEQWQPQPDGTLIVRVLQISGLSYTYADANPVGSKIIEVRGADGRPIDRAATYSVTMNSFLADGGDGFTVFRQGRDRQGGPVDLDGLISYIGKQPQPLVPPAAGRIVVQ